MAHGKYGSIRGFISLDALMSLAPLLLMMLLLMQLSALLAKKAQEAAYRQQLFDKLASAADYTVKIGAARHVGDVRYPNWLDEGTLTDSYAASLKDRLGVSSLYVGLKPPEGTYAMCLYRLVVVGKEKNIYKLYVCGR